MYNFIKKKKIIVILTTFPSHSFMQLNQNVYHKKQIINILKKQIEELIENTNNKKIRIYEKIEQVEKKKKYFL